MPEILFYHLTKTPLERTLPDLLEKSLARGWRVLVRGTDTDRLAFLDNVLWSYRDDAFLAHGLTGCERPEQQPIFLTNGDEIPNNPDILMLVDGRSLNVEEAGDYQRICLLFDGNDPEAVSGARDDWKAAVTANLAAKYWTQETGKWEQKIVHDPNAATP